MEQSTRDKVKSVLSIELRRFETKLADLLDQEEKKNGTSPAPSSNGTKAAPRAYDTIIKNYCRFLTRQFRKQYFYVELFELYLICSMGPI